MKGKMALLYVVPLILGYCLQCSRVSEIEQKDLLAKTPEELAQRLRKARTLEDIFEVKDTLRLEARDSSLIAKIRKVEFIDSNRLVVLDYDGRKVMLFTRSGKYLRQIGAMGMNYQCYNNPCGLMLHDTSIIVLDDNNKWLFFDRSGNFVDEIKFTKEYCGKAMWPQHFWYNKVNNCFYFYMFFPFDFNAHSLPGRKHRVFVMNDKHRIVNSFVDVDPLDERFDINNGDCSFIDKKGNFWTINYWDPFLFVYDPTGKMLTRIPLPTDNVDPFISRADVTDITDPLSSAMFELQKSTLDVKAVVNYLDLFVMVAYSSINVFEWCIYDLDGTLLTKHLPAVTSITTGFDRYPPVGMTKDGAWFSVESEMDSSGTVPNPFLVLLGLKQDKK